jgi:hypothetical protein
VLTPTGVNVIVDVPRVFDVVFELVNMHADKLGVLDVELINPIEQYPVDLDKVEVVILPNIVTPVYVKAIINLFAFE